MDETTWHEAMAGYPVDRIDHAGLPGRPNLFDIAGFPNSELASSNTLAWLLDPTGSHGLGTLVLESLLARIDWGDAVSDDATVDTETVTGKNNRIDVLIRLPDLAVVIENKVLSGLYNDLADYREHAREENGTDAVVIVLRPHHRDDLDRYRSDGLEPETDLFEVLYDDLFDEILARMGPYVMDADPCGVDLLVQYIDNYSPRRTEEAMSEYERTISRFLERSRGIERQILAVRNDYDDYAIASKNKLHALMEAIKAKVSTGLKDPEGNAVTVKETIEVPKKAPSTYYGLIFHLAGHTDNIGIELLTDTNPWRMSDWGREDSPIATGKATFDSLIYKAYIDSRKRGKPDTAVRGLHDPFIRIFDDARLSTPFDILLEAMTKHFQEILELAWNTTLTWDTEDDHAIES